MVAIQLRIFTPVGTAMNIVDTEKAATEIGPMPEANMWWAHTPQPMKPMAMPENDHERVAEDRLAGEHRDDLGHDPEGRQDQDVDLRVPEDPEQVLPEQRVGALRRR